MSRVAPSDTLNPDQRVSAAGSPAFRRNLTCKDHLRVIAPVIHHRIRTSPGPSEYPLVIIPVTGAREDTRLPHTPMWRNSIRSGPGLCLPHLLSPLSAPHLLLAPFPALLPALFPDPRASLHVFPRSEGGMVGLLKRFRWCGTQDWLKQHIYIWGCSYNSSWRQNARRRYC